MKKLTVAVVFALVIQLGTLMAQSPQQYAGRLYAAGILTNVVFDTSQMTAPCRLANMSVRYNGESTNGTVQVWARLSGTEYLYLSNSFARVSSWVYTGTDIWIKPDKRDTIILRSNITNLTGSVTLDFVR